MNRKNIGKNNNPAYFREGFIKKHKKVQKNYLLAAKTHFDEIKVCHES
jgi:hypothetical protein